MHKGRKIFRVATLIGTNVPTLVHLTHVKR